MLASRPEGLLSHSFDECDHELVVIAFRVDGRVS
jgi:hypothetical protein